MSDEKTNVIEPLFGSKTQLPAFLDYTARGGAALLAIIYVTGFLVVSFHASLFGILEFNLIRPHMFSAGALFVMLTALPSYAAMNYFGWVGPRSAVLLPNARPVSHTTLLSVCRFASYYFLCFTMTIGTAIVFAKSAFAFPETFHGFDLSMYVLFPFLVLWLLSNFYFDRLWFLFVPAILIASVFELWIVYRYFDRYFLGLSLWYFSVGIVVLGLTNALRNPKWRMTVQWEMVPFSFLSFLFIYSTALYQGLRPSIGGGAPTTAILYFSAKTPLSDSDSARVLLLEETDAGFYILLNVNEASAYYIRRDLVVAIKYGGADDKVQPAKEIQQQQSLRP